jgi:hypothetical protein
MRQFTYKVATGHGISDGSFSTLQNPDRPLQGTGQGLGSAPPGHVIIADIGNTALTKHHPHALLCHPSPTVPPLRQQNSLFMDDMILYANLVRVTRELMQRFGWSQRTTAAHVLQHLIRTYSKYLWTAGGCLNLSKCYWYFLQFSRLKNGTYALLPLSQSTFDMSITEKGLSEKTIVVPQLDVSTCQRSLGVHLSPTGCSFGQRLVLVEKAKKWAMSIRSGNLNAAQIWIAYTSVLWPGLCYPLAASSLTVLDLKLVQQKVSTIIRHSLHLNRSFPDALFYGAKKFGGLGIVPLIVQQCFMKLSLFLRHLRA